YICAMKIIKFIVRVLLLVSSVFVIAFGSALCIRANVGCIPVSVGPYVWTSAGGMSIGGFRVPQWTVGAYTFIIYAVCFFLQIILLRRKYQPLQLFQFAIAVIAGYFLDLSMDLTEIFQWQSIPISMIQLLIGDFIIGFGISLEVLPHLLMKPTDGFILAVSDVTNSDFGKVKIIFDTSLVVIAIVCMLIFFRTWRWNMIGIGTLISMVFVGYCVSLLKPFMSRLETKLY
ncbi:MAG: DUF6198 family protein, partial [Bacteroidales bacterium]|nr:DUF6198 family protein [Bacteroidales bacterium]